MKMIGYPPCLMQTYGAIETIVNPNIVWITCYLSHCRCSC